MVDTNSAQKLSMVANILISNHTYPVPHVRLSGKTCGPPPLKPHVSLEVYGDFQDTTSVHLNRLISRIEVEQQDDDGIGRIEVEQHDVDALSINTPSVFSDTN